MKIGIVVYGSIDQSSGGYLYDRKLVEYLMSKGIKVRIFSQESGNYLSKITGNYDPGLVCDISEFSPDMLVEDELNHPSLFEVNKMLRRKFDFPILSIVHHLHSSENNNLFLQPVYWFFEKKYLLTVDGFVFNSHSTRDAVGRLSGACEKYVVSYPGKDRLDISVKAEDILKKSKAGRLKILFVGNIIPRKGLHFLIKALSSIDADLWELNVVGNKDADIKYFRDIEKAVLDLDIAGNVFFSGEISDEKLKQVLLNSDVLAVPSFHEGFGIVYTEAITAGVPVMAGASGGGREIITDGVNGFIVGPGDVKAMAHKISGLSRNRDIVKNMSLKALESSKKFPTWVESMDKIYRFILSF